MTFTIYHNPKCGTSRNVLAALREAGHEPQVIEYLKTPPSRVLLESLIARAGITPRALLREKGTPFAELGLDDPALTDAQRAKQAKRKLRLSLPTREPYMPQIKQLCAEYPGDVPVYLLIADEGITILLDSAFWTSAAGDALAAYVALLGAGTALLRED